MRQIALLLLALSGGVPLARPAELIFQGQKVTIAEPPADEDGFYPRGPAKLCFEGQCYTAPAGFGRNPKAELVRFSKRNAALLFSAESGGVSGWRVHFALLQPGKGREPENLFCDDASVTNQSRHAFLHLPAISPRPIFVTADYAPGKDEGHYGAHRYIISVHARGTSGCYLLADRFMTARRYDLDKNEDPIRSERAALLRRLRRTRRVGQDRNPGRHYDAGQVRRLQCPPVTALEGGL